MKKKKLGKQTGFTIVELLVVIVVIGILSTIVLNVFNSAQRRAEVASVQNGTGQMIKGLRAALIYEGRTTWWPEYYWADAGYTDIGSENPPLRRLRDYAGYDDYIQNIPSTTNFPASAWRYDADNNTPFIGCPSVPGDENGVNLIIPGHLNIAYIEELDKRMDDGDLNCGKGRLISKKYFYLLSNSLDDKVN